MNLIDFYVIIYQYQTPGFLATNCCRLERRLLVASRARTFYDIDQRLALCHALEVGDSLVRFSHLILWMAFIGAFVMIFNTSVPHLTLDFGQ